MESANVFQEKDRGFGDLSCGYFVSWRYLLRYSAHDVISACASSAIRVSNSVKNSDSKDITYDENIMALWAISEMACGILAMCLPVSPKFFRSFKDSSLWSGLRSSFYFFLRFKTEAGWTFSTHSDENKAAKSDDSLQLQLSVK
jgi:hypothetical protein